MKYAIKRSFSGFEITNGDEQFLYKDKIFSFSGKLTNINNYCIGSFDRKFSWNYFFVLTTDYGVYNFTYKFGNAILKSVNTGETFKANSQFSFLNDKQEIVSYMNKEKTTIISYTFDITNKKHLIALLIANCFLLNLIASS